MNPQSLVTGYSFLQDVMAVESDVREDVSLSDRGVGIWFNYVGISSALL